MICTVFCSPCTILYGEDSTTKDEQNAQSAFASILAVIDVEPGKPTFKVEWKYTNPWEYPMFVQDIASSCGCLAILDSERKPVAKGESSTISATFIPGSHRGLMRKSLHVRFIGYDKPVELVAEARIPSPVELSERELSWTPEEFTKTQTIEVTSGTNQKFSITGILGVSEKLYTIRKEAVTESHYRLHITPASKKVSGIQILQVRTNSPDPRDQLFAVFLSTKKSTSSDDAATVKNKPVPGKSTKP